MSRRNSLIFIFLLILLLIFLYILKNSAKESYHEELSNLNRFEIEAKTVAKLKNSIGKKRDKRVLASLNRLAKPSKDLINGNTHVIVYENLTLPILSSILRKIENSTLIIKKLQIDRTSADSASMRLEISE